MAPGATTGAAHRRVLGDPGVGKTTLTNAFVSTCQMEGAAIARAQAYDAERELPFAVLAELIKQLTLQRAIGGADPEALSELTPRLARDFHRVPRRAEACGVGGGSHPAAAGRLLPQGGRGRY